MWISLLPFAKTPSSWHIRGTLAPKARTCGATVSAITRLMVRLGESRSHLLEERLCVTLHGSAWLGYDPPMPQQLTPAQFVAKWKPVELSERAASQSHFNDLCELLGQPNPTDHDATGAEYTFEKGVTSTAATSPGPRCMV